MRVIHLQCGPFVNESEKLAFVQVDKALRQGPGDDTVHVLTNLTHANERAQADEIDMVVIGPGGAVVVEVKHWDGAALRRPDTDGDAELIIAKAKRIAGRLKRAEPRLDFVPATFLFTRAVETLKRGSEQAKHRLGVRAYALKDVGAMLADAAAPGGVKSERLAALLAPRQLAEIGDRPTRLARFDKLELLSPPEDRFARTYAGRDPRTGDWAIIHLYDLSAVQLTSEAVAERLAKRDFEVALRFQKSAYLSSLLDTWQALPGHPGEMFFFSLADSAAAPVATLQSDPAWSAADRRGFAEHALRALAELGAAEAGAEPLIHRAIDPQSVRVRASGAPLFAGWRWAKMPQALTITGTVEPGLDVRWAAPEVAAGGLAAATPVSDLYSLCAVLSTLFADDAAERDALSLGMAPDPGERPSASELAELLAPGPQPAATPAEPAVERTVPASRWDEGHVLRWNDRRYRVVSVLGAGAAGRTFKLEELEGEGDEWVATFVGKAVLNEEVGRASLDAYRRLVPHTQHDALSNVLYCSASWSPDTLTALLRWTEGEPLDAFRGALDIQAGLVDAPDVESLVLAWFETLCGALDRLHALDWVHGDVSPSNVLVHEDRVVLIDYDLAGPAECVPRSPGTALYASPERRAGGPAKPRDDVYALAATLFHAVTDRKPQREAGAAGLPWTADERAAMPRLTALLDIAAAADPSARFERGAAAVRRLRAEAVVPLAQARPPAPVEPSPLTPNVVPRVRDILSAYPGSAYGNLETRGLDTAFAEETYVDTDLDESLRRSIADGSVSLVILCGNAGDGKTAFLQRLLARLGASAPPSRERVWDGAITGRPVKVNLDGAASWRGRTADDLLDELFEPYLHGPAKGGRTHLVAVNDGRLLEWIDHAEGRQGGMTPLLEQLSDALNREGGDLPPHIRLVELNNRSLVGGWSADGGGLSTAFVDTLIARLVGGDQAAETWRPCRTCTAQARCPMKRSADMMGASADGAVLAEGVLLRRRLTNALQAVHQRGEVHITARELKAAVSYILFGLLHCTDLHAQPDRPLHHPADHAFDPESVARQGGLLRELARIDPALESHARIDRYLMRVGAPDPAHGAPRFTDAAARPLPLRQARRRAYLSWTDEQIAAVGGSAEALTFKDGRRAAEFRDFPTLPAARREAILARLCLGLSRLEQLPDIAFRRLGAVPVRIVPRTQTETAFWVGKPLAKFSLEPERLAASEGLDALHRHLTLAYTPERGPVERLTVPLELYALLMDLAEGVQILDAFSDDVFANLGVFVQRLAQEDERNLRAWNPGEEDTVYALCVERRDGRQTIVLQPEPA